jgi:hypothetical protein
MIRGTVQPQKKGMLSICSLLLETPEKSGKVRKTLENAGKRWKLPESSGKHYKKTRIYHAFFLVALETHLKEVKNYLERSEQIIF